MNMTVLFKKYTYGLLLIATTLIGFACNFTNATNYTCNDNSFTISENSYFIIDYAGGGTRAGFFDISNEQTGDDYCFNSNRGITIDNSCTPINSFPLILTPGTYIINCTSIQTSSFSVVPAITSCPTCPTCEEQYTSEECQEEYDLIPTEDINQEYCTSNNLCPIIEGTGDVQWSALYINNVQHLGNDIINIDIPEEIERDYNYGSGETNIDVIGYGYDQEKMQSMVNTQFTPPTSEDLENVIGKIADFLPLLAIMILIVYAWRLIKKVF